MSLSNTNNGLQIRGDQVILIIRKNTPFQYFYYNQTIVRILNVIRTFLISKYSSTNYVVFHSPLNGWRNRQVLLIAHLLSNTAIKEADEASFKGLGRAHEDL